ncbi:unnamed protein product [Tuber melanosporum]|uniref:(Perigord truffle) hypothetical protein n=1 Tax=Tuber melanosporum (strain Mel28) TaxID=656061 RepID=D5GAB6_TUBMM|nr:uncharacterized protein GSTUM_00005223001 [Tuber melanosporum]CAZ81470.1 unnamed protein product [Tuber melanosporum]
MPIISPSDGNIHPQLTQAQPGPSTAGQESNTSGAQASPFQGWETYPLMLTNYNTLSQNGRVLSERLSSDSERLFRGPTDASLEILQVLETPDPDSPVIQRKANSATFENILMDDRRFHFRCFLSAWKLTLASAITPGNSWAKLPITEEMLRKLLTFYKVSPHFLRVVHFFGRQTRERISSSAAFRCLFTEKETDPAAHVSEICVRMVHVEKHGRVDPDIPNDDPWSVRQIGYYQRFDYEDSSSVCIHIRPPKDVNSRLVEALVKGRFSKGSDNLSPMSLHLAFVTTAMKNWQAYVEYLESELVKHRECVLLTDEDWKASREDGDIRAGYSDFRKLQRYFRDKLLNTLSIFDLNMDVMEGLKIHNQRLRSLGLLSHAACNDASDMLEHNTSMLRELRRDTETILERTGSAAQLIQALFEIRNDTLIRSYTLATSKLVDMAADNCKATASLVQMARDSQGDAQLMVQFAGRTKRDSVTMRVATMLATLYLPGTFVATVFGMDFFHSDIEIEHGKKIYSFSVATQIWIFSVIVVVLTAVTVTSFWLWERGLRRKDEAVRRDSIKTV